ncbi:MAG: YCF48-related protein [Ignavibacteria bacterium]
MKPTLILIFIVIFLLCDQIAFSQSQWFWQSSVPQGNSLAGISIINSGKAVTVGGLGTIMMTDDAGLNWDIKYHIAGPYQYLTSVFFINENTGWVTAYQGNVIKTTNGGLNWLQVSSAVPYPAAIDFINENSGWITGIFGVNSKTTNGGLSWIKQDRVTDYLYSVDFLNKDTGWTVGGNGLNGAAIFRTTNGAQNWVTHKTLTYGPFRGVKFIDRNTGWVVGNSSLVFKSTNSGVNWNQIQLAQNVDLFSVDFKDHNTGWTVGNYRYDDYKSVILKTTDGGISWDNQDIESYATLTSVKYKDNICWAVGASGTIFKSTDEENWIPLSRGVQNTINSIFFIDTLTGWCAGNTGTIAKTLDSGRTWERQVSGTIYDLPAIAFANRDTGWVVGGYEDMFTGYKFFIKRTTNGGMNWITQDSGRFPQLNSISFISSNEGWISGAVGTILHTTNAGENWNFQVSGVTDKLLSIIFKDNVNGWAMGEYGNVLKTTNGGLNWQIVDVSNNANLGTMFFLDINTGWIGAGPNILKTTNSGNNWNLIYSTTDVSGFGSLYFTDTNTGWGVGGRYFGVTIGSVKKTTNGGLSWTEQPINVEGTLNSIFFTSANAGYAAGNGGVIIKTNDILVSSSFLNSIVPDEFILYQNFPNPFNPSTSIKFAIPTSGNISLKVFDIVGKEVAELINGFRNAGTYEINFDASYLSSGIYFYKLVTNGNVKTMKMSLIR